MFSRITSSNSTHPAYIKSVASSSFSVDSIRGPLTPSALSGTLSGLLRHLDMLQQYELKVDQLNTDYFEKLLPTLYPITQQGSLAALESALHGALSQRQHLIEQIGLVRVSLAEQGQQLKSTRQQIRDVHTQVYNSIMLNQSRVREQTRSYQREAAKLEQQALRLQQKAEKCKGGLEGVTRLAKLPEIAHAARCVDLLFPKEQPNATTLEQKPTDSTLLKTVFGFSRLWMSKPWPVSSPQLALLLEPNERVVEGLADKVGLSPKAIRFVMQLAGLNAVMHANQHGNEVTAKVQSVIRAVLGRAIVALFMANRFQKTQGNSASLSDNPFSEFDKKYSEWFFPVLDQKKMRFVAAGLSVSDPKVYFKGLLDGFARYMVQACKQNSVLQPALIQFKAALDDTLKQTKPEEMFAVIQYCAGLSFSDIAHMKHPLYREALSSSPERFEQSEVGKAMSTHLGVRHGSSSAETYGNDAAWDAVRHFYLNYHPTPELMYANPDVQDMFTEKLGLLKQHIVPVKQVIDPKAVPVEDLSVALAGHTLGAMEHQGTCISLAQTCFKILADHQENALSLSGLEQELTEVEQAIQSCLLRQQHNQQQEQQIKTKERQVFSDLQKAQHTARSAQTDVLSQLTDFENSPLLPLFVHRDAFVSFVDKHVDISTEQLKRRALESGHSASRYNKAEGVLNAILDLYELANLPQYGGPAQQCVIDDEVSHIKSVGQSMLVRNGKCIPAKADTSVFSLVRESVNHAWRIKHLYPK